MKPQTKKRWLIVANATLAVLIIALLFATFLPAIIGAAGSGGR